MAVRAKRQRAPRKPPTVTPSSESMARLTFMLLAQFIETQQPEKLAAQVALVDDTLSHCARIQTFFERYVAALKARRVQ